MSEKSKSSARLIVGYSLVSWFNAVLAFLLIPVATRVFEPAVLGRLNIFLSAVLVLYPLLSLGLNQGLIRFTSNGEQEGHALLTFSTGLTALVSAVLLAVSALLWRPVSIYLVGFESFLVACALPLVSSAVATIQLLACWYRAHNNLWYYVVLMISFGLLTKFFHIVAGALGFDLDQIIGSLAIAAAVLAAISLWFCRHQFGRRMIAPSIRREAIMFSIPLALSSVLSMLNTYTPVFALNAFSEYAAVGVFSTAVTLASALNLAATGFNTFWPTYVFQNWKTKGAQIYAFHEIVVLGGVALGFLLIVLRDPISLVLGGQYREAVSLLPILLTSPVCYVIAETTGIGMQITKESGLYIFIYGVSAAVNLFVALVLIPYFHEYGAAASSAVSALLMLSLKTYFGEKRFRSVSSVRYMVGGITAFYVAAFVVTIFDLGCLESLLFLMILYASLLFLMGRSRLKELGNMTAKAIQSVLGR